MKNFSNVLRKHSLLTSAKQTRQQHFISKKIKISEPVPNGWKKARELKASTIIERKKDSWKLFEDRIWLLFYKFEFEEINLNYEPELILPKKPELKVRFDVIAKSDEFVFFVECKTKEKLGSHSLLETITLLHAHKRYLKKLVREHYDDDYLDVVPVLAIDNIQLSQQELNEAKKKGVKIWNKGTIKYIEKLANLTPKIGDAARYQLYAMMFPKKKHQTSSNVPAIQCHAGKITYYNFMATPEQLLKIAHVHRRGSGLADAKKVVLTYQRMLETAKLKSITNYINSHESLPFANSIIINFNEKVRFDLASERDDNIKNGQLRLPRTYGSAWIIDGQHRLFGYANSRRRRKDLIPVIAFEKLSDTEQARLFVDINQNQKKVSANLLWDLKEDIYDGTTDRNFLKELIISKVGKRLASDKKSPLYSSVVVPSYPELSENAPVTLNTICATIKSTGILGEKYFNSDALPVDEAVEIVYAMLAEHFSFFANVMKYDWEKGKNGFSRSSNGVAALIWLFKQTLHYLNFIEVSTVYSTISKRKQFYKQIESLYEPINRQFKEFPDMANSLRKKRGASGQKESADILCTYIGDDTPNFPRLFKNKLSITSKTNLTRDELDLAVRDTELEIRSFVKQHLKKQYNEMWYKQCLPGDVKTNIEKLVNREIKKFPYKEQYLKILENRFEYVQIGDLKKIITKNWTVFEVFFKSKESIGTKMDHFINIRNALRAHPREVDDAQKQLGQGAMIWLRQCIDNPER